MHRIGRTGRAGLSGRAITFVAPAEELSMRGIERLTGQVAERVLLPSFGGAQEAAIRGTKAFAPLRGAGSGRRSFRPRRSR